MDCSTTCLLDLSISPLSSRELPRVQRVLRERGIAPQWQHTIERQSVHLLEMRVELPSPPDGEQRLAEGLARDIWKAIGRYVRVVFIFPHSELWPGGLEFGEADYTRLLRSH